MKLVLLLTQLLLFCQLSVQNIISTGEKSALLIIDVQNCFLEGGSLAVPDGNQVIPVINNLRNKFENVVLTQDWHCVNHVSFASVHPGEAVYSTIKLEYDENGNLCNNEPKCQPDEIEYTVDQTLWPDHCVKNTQGAEVSTKINKTSGDIIIRKGFNCDIDSYSAFYDNGAISETELNDKLIGLDVDTLYIVGLALDYCVFYSAKDAKGLGFKVYVVEDATRGISPEGISDAVQDMKDSGINIIQSSEILGSSSQFLRSSSTIILLVTILPSFLKYV